MLPNDPTLTISNVTFKIGEKSIEAKVFKKEEAKEKYEDGLASGKAVMLANENEKDKDTLEINIGNVLPGEIVAVTIKILKVLDIEGGAYAFRLPLVYFPKFKADLNEGG